jgi:hypothetical protein
MTDAPEEYFGNFSSSHKGPPRIVRFGDKDFFYFPAGDGVAIYRIETSEDQARGPILKLASALAGAEPLPDGTIAKEPWKRENRFLWSWHDEKAKAVRRESIDDRRYSENPKDWEWPSGGITVDERMAWLASYLHRPPCPGRGVRDLCDSSQGVDKEGNLSMIGMPPFESSAIRRPQRAGIQRG